jgi:hypothetical protein
MEAVSSSETSVIIYQTILRNIPEDNHLRIHRRENLKSYLDFWGVIQILYEGEYFELRYCRV